LGERLEVAAVQPERVRRRAIAAGIGKEWEAIALLM
jgi:hypothetical protein